MFDAAHSIASAALRTSPARTVMVSISTTARKPRPSIMIALQPRAQRLDRRAELAQLWADLLMVDQMPIAELLTGRRC
ncbi:hypothetical protein [Methylocella sp.]|uniref:hypothetical protein n=1 Tax=Methylocella sp. TaxID=1978226 RepID=UPI00378302E2